MSQPMEIAPLVSAVEALTSRYSELGRRVLVTLNQPSVDDTLVLLKEVERERRCLHSMGLVNPFESGGSELSEGDHASLQTLLMLEDALQKRIRRVLDPTPPPGPGSMYGVDMY